VEAGAQRGVEYQLDPCGVGKVSVTRSYSSPTRFGSLDPASSPVPASSHEPITCDKVIGDVDVRERRTEAGRVEHVALGHLDLVAPWHVAKPRWRPRQAAHAEPALEQQRHQPPADVPRRPLTTTRIVTSPWFASPWWPHGHRFMVDRTIRHHERYDRPACSGPHHPARSARPARPAWRLP
jgi:hypothetical protein